MNTSERDVALTAQGLTLGVIGLISGMIVWLTPGGLDFSDGFTITVLVGITVQAALAMYRARHRGGAR